MYSFHSIYKATEYKFSVVMTTENDDGAAVEKINTLSMSCVTEYSNKSSVICGPVTGRHIHQY